ncbi:hypothetical protein BVRB_4g092850 [Beta vulgaris subsp. vulgaris]|nr:hypothetical protein BVRB_4g092850 [Beta vulgaris subsp. vulgaris]
MDGSDFLLFMAVAWEAWSYRNSVAHGEPWSNRDMGVIGFLKLVQDYRDYAAVVHNNSSSTRCVISRDGWCRPRAGFVRINTDAAVMGADGVESGMVIRDGEGKVVILVVQRVTTCWSATMVEVVAVRFGLQVASGFWLCKDETRDGFSAWQRL